MEEIYWGLWAVCVVSFRLTTATAIENLLLIVASSSMLMKTLLPNDFESDTGKKDALWDALMNNERKHLLGLAQD